MNDISTLRDRPEGPIILVAGLGDVHRLAERCIGNIVTRLDDFTCGGIDRSVGHDFTSSTSVQVPVASRVSKHRNALDGPAYLGAAEPEIRSVEMEANTSYSEDTLPRRD
ncbi:MAG: hypothetical protein WCC64_12695 [Aliidongia sp.]